MDVVAHENALSIGFVQDQLDVEKRANRIFTQRTVQDGACTLVAVSRSYLMQFGYAPPQLPGHGLSRYELHLELGGKWPPLEIFLCVSGSQWDIDVQNKRSSSYKRILLTYLVLCHCIAVDLLGNISGILGSVSNLVNLAVSNAGLETLTSNLRETFTFDILQSFEFLCFNADSYPIFVSFPAEEYSHLPLSLQSIRKSGKRRLSQVSSLYLTCIKVWNYFVLLSHSHSVEHNSTAKKARKDTVLEVNRLITRNRQATAAQIGLLAFPSYNRLQFARNIFLNGVRRKHKIQLLDYFKGRRFVVASCRRSADRQSCSDKIRGY